MERNVIIMYNLINELIGSKDLLEVNFYLKKVDAFLSGQNVNRSDFCKHLAQSLADRTQSAIYVDLYQPDIAGFDNYYICSADECMTYYLAFNGLAIGKVREVRQHMKDIIAYIDGMIIAPTGNSITVEKEKKILSILEEKYPFWSIVPDDNPLYILNINNSNRLYNSNCGMSENYTQFAISMYNMKDTTTAPEYVFLHELGHVFQASITKSKMAVPDEFIQFHNSIPNSVRLEHGNPDAAEVFADTFAVAVMHETELSCYDPFNFPIWLNKDLEALYTDLSQKYAQD